MRSEFEQDFFTLHVVTLSHHFYKDSPKEEKETYSSSLIETFTFIK